MTTLVNWFYLVRLEDRYVVNGCLESRITEHEARKESRWWAGDDWYRRLVVRRLAPLVWLAMPCHDDPMTDERR